ncbi:MAG: TonB-dependent receptor [Gemmatimonadaceae bacterium]|nr:TonB-dependent receptor [Gemmatimonadaceae bacterium]
MMSRAVSMPDHLPRLLARRTAMPARRIARRLALTMRAATLAITVAVAALPARASAQGAPPTLPAGYRPLESFPAIGAFTTVLDVQGDGRALPDVLADVARKAGLEYAADRALGADVKVTAVLRGVSARDALLRLTAGTAVQLLVGPRGELVAMARTAAPRRTLRLSGFVRSAESREVVRRASIIVDNEAPRDGTDDGTYFVSLTPGPHRLRVRAIGYALLDTTVTLQQNTVRDLTLRTRTVELAAVQVKATRRDDERADLDPRVPDMSTVRLDLQTMKRAPTVLGEPDPIRTLTYLPGVTTASDASTAFSVRGGATDQNLILLDEAPIYNPSHVLGFLSTFNSDAVDNVMLYKGAIPARFGGRLSSVVDIRQREGNAARFAGSASIGLLSSRALFEGPLVKRDRGSFMIAARRSYADALARLSNDSSVNDAIAYFYDVNAKANWRLGETGALMLSGYLGRDAFGDRTQFDAGWGNRSATLRWNQLVGGRLLSKVTAATSSYDYRLRFALEAPDSARWVASIRSTDLRVDQTWRLNDRNAIEFGAEVNLGTYRPGDVTVVGQQDPSRRTVETRTTTTVAAYLGQEVELGPRVAIRYGVRWAGFERGGPWWQTRYANDAPLVWDATLQRYLAGTVLDSTRVSGRAARYDGWEPRASMRILVTPNSSIKLSAARTQQFIQLVSNTTSPTPLDVWEPAGPWIRPQRADQAALGWTQRGRLRRWRGSHPQHAPRDGARAGRGACTRPRTAGASQRRAHHPELDDRAVRAALPHARQRRAAAGERDQWRQLVRDPLRSHAQRLAGGGAHLQSQVDGGRHLPLLDRAPDDAPGGAVLHRRAPRARVRPAQQRAPPQLPPTRPERHAPARSR